MKAHSLVVLLRSFLVRSFLALLALPLAPCLVAADPLPKLTVERINSEPVALRDAPQPPPVAPRREAAHLPAPVRGSLEPPRDRRLDGRDDAPPRRCPGGRPRRQAAAAAPHLGHVAPRRPHPARARGGRRVHRGREHRRRARPREDAGDRGVPRGLPRRHAGRIRPQERPVGRGPGHRQGDPPHPGRLRHPPQRKARLGLRGGAGLPRRPGVPLVAGLPGDRLPAARPVPRADLPHRGLRARAQRGRVAALPQGGRPELDRPPGRRLSREGRHARPRAPRVLHPGRRLRPAPARLDGGFPPGGVPAPQPGPGRAGAAPPARPVHAPRPPRDAPHRPHRAIEDLAQHLRRPALPEGRAALPVALRAGRVRPRLPLRRRRGVPARDPGALDGGRPRVLHRLRAGLRAGRAERLPVLHRDREGPARAAPLPGPAGRHRPHAPHPRGRHAPDGGRPRRAVLRGHLVGRADPAEAVGVEPGRDEAARRRGERQPAHPGLRARDASSSSR